MKISKEKFLKNIELYSSNNTKNKSFIAIPSNKEGYIHKMISSYCEFDNNPIKIPKNYTKEPEEFKMLMMDYIETNLCRKKPTSKEIQKYKKDFKNTLNIDKWYKNSRKYWITINDIEQLLNNKKKNEIIVLMLDRNYLDIAMGHNKKNKSYNVNHFFRFNKYKVIYDKNLKGKLIYLNKKDPYKVNFEFEVEYKKDNWYPFINGYLPKNDPQGFDKLLGKKIHFSKFPKNTHIGFRGPMILWENIDKLPDIFEGDDWLIELLES